MRSLDEFEKKIGYRFKNRNLLITALTHSSYANESRGGDQSYERLEFLGDSILGFVTAEYLCKAFPDIPEGKLTKKRAALVCEKSLCGFTRSFGAGELLRLSHGEQHSGGRERPSILADVFESITAAIYLDSAAWRRPSALYCTTLNRRRSLQANARLKTTRRCCRRSFSRTPVNGSNTSSPANMAPTMTSTSP